VTTIRDVIQETFLRNIRTRDPSGLVWIAVDPVKYVPPTVEISGRSDRSRGLAVGEPGCPRRTLGFGSGYGECPGDWRSGSALRSHRRGHWFEPSIAHQIARCALPENVSATVDAPGPQGSQQRNDRVGCATGRLRTSGTVSRNSSGPAQPSSRRSATSAAARLIALVKDADSNVIGLIQTPDSAGATARPDLYYAQIQPLEVVGADS
jgi:hypothetical protein